MSFASSHPSLLRALSERGYTDPTPVQAAVLKPETANRDLLVSAQTGSGKTIAYGMAVASTVLGEGEGFGGHGHPEGLVVVPTPELGMQVHKKTTWPFSERPGPIVSLVGGP